MGSRGEGTTRITSSWLGACLDGGAIIRLGKGGGCGQRLSLQTFPWERGAEIQVELEVSRWLRKPVEG